MRLLLLLFPWLELLSLIQLGIETSALFALGWVLLMMVVGGALLKRVGMNSLNRLREAQQSGILQQSLLLDDLAMAVAALLLFIPGLLSDFFAVVVLIGPLRRLLARLLMGSGSVDMEFRHFGDGASNGSTFEGDFEIVDSQQQITRQSSSRDATMTAAAEHISNTSDPTAQNADTKKPGDGRA